MAVWLQVFLSPSAGLFLALLGDWHGVTPPSDRAVEWLFGLVPLVALLVCCAAASVSARSVARRVVWMVFTLLAMGCQCGLILVILAIATGLERAVWRREDNQRTDSPMLRLAISVLHVSDSIAARS